MDELDRYHDERWQEVVEIEEPPPVATEKSKSFIKVTIQ